MTAPVVNAPAPTPGTPATVLPTAPVDDTTPIDDNPTPLGGDAPEEETQTQAENEEEEEEVPLGVDDDEEGDEEEGEDLDDEQETPLAEFEQESKGKLSAWWSIIPIVVGAVTGKTVYDKKHKKGIFAEKKSKDDDKGNK